MRNLVDYHLQKSCGGQEGALLEALETAAVSHNCPNEVVSDNDLKILSQNWIQGNQLQASCVLLAVPTIEKNRFITILARHFYNVIKVDHKFSSLNER